MWQRAFRDDDVVRTAGSGREFLDEYILRAQNMAQAEGGFLPIKEVFDIRRPMGGIVGSETDQLGHCLRDVGYIPDE